MYKVEKKEEYVVLARSGTCFKFETYEKLLEWLKRVKVRDWYKQYGNIDRVGNNWNDSCVVPDGSWPYCWSVRKLADYIVFDSYNRVVNVEWLIRDLENLPDHSYRRWRRPYGWKVFSDPVPYTGKRSRGSYQLVRTTQELRRNSWDKEYARAKRCKNYLPNDWEYEGRSNKYCGNKSWKKRKKRKQWM